MSLGERDLEELELLLEAEQDWVKYNKLETMYPVGEPLSIEHYPKHLECFGYGPKYRHRCFMGGNGCNVLWSTIETADGLRQLSTLIGSGEFVVPSWDGESRRDARSSGVFLKEFAPAFHVQLDNGQSFSCSHTHRVSTSMGWMTLGALLHGGASGLRYMRTAEGSTASYARAPRRGDAPLRLAAGSDLASPPSPVDVRKRLRYLVSQGDVAEHKPVRIHAYRGTVRLPTRIYDPAQVAALCASYSDPAPALDALWCSETRQAGSRLAVESGQTPAWSGAAWGQHRSSASGSDASRKSLAASGTSEGLASWTQARQLSARLILPGQWPEEWIDGDLGEWMFCPSEHVSLIGGAKIISVIPLGVQPIVDFTVEETACYWTAGVLHHNTGKSYGLGGYEVALHLTGDYPIWWTGIRYDDPYAMFGKNLEVWVCGDTRETVRDIMQTILLGDFAKEGDDALGTGLIPKDRIGRVKVIANTGNSCDFALIKHKSGQWAKVKFKAYEQGRKAFQGTSIPFILLDEEPPFHIFQECMQRGRGVDGRILLTFTPLSGHTEVVDNFLGWEKKNKEGGSVMTTSCAWDDVPHLSEDWMRETLAMTPAYLRNARRRGIPSAGVGAVYPIEEDQFVIAPIPLPSHFRRCFGFDHGWHNTAAVWAAWDKDSDIVYVYSDYKRGEQPIEVHAVAIKARGDWIPGAGDSSARDSDGQQIINKYKGLGVKMSLPDKSVDAGIQEVMSRLSTGRLKIFSTCQKTIDEFRRYHYNEKQNIVKENDHLMDCLRYIVMTGLKLSMTARTPPPDQTSTVSFG